MMQQYLIKELKQRFQDTTSFSKEDLLDFYLQFEPNMEETELPWRIYALKKKAIIGTVKKGVYRLEKRQLFTPQLDDRIQAIGDFLKQYDPHNTYSLWDTVWLNEMIELQVTSSMIVLEADKFMVETLFYGLRDRHFKNVFIKPDEATVQRYISELTDCIIVKPIISRSPLIKQDSIPIASIEKILVDIFCDEKMYFAFQGNQLLQIYSSALDKYSINFTKLINYAKRRKRDEELKHFLTHYLPDHIKDIIE